MRALVERRRLVARPPVRPCSRCRSVLVAFALVSMRSHVDLCVVARRDAGVVVRSSRRYAMNANLKPLRRLLLFAGFFNISLAFPLAVPWLIGPYLGALSSLDATLGLGGKPLEVPAPGAPALLANTAGIDLVLIGVLVLYAAFDPARRTFIVVANAAGRLLFALVVAYYVVAFDVARIVLAIAGIDVAIGIGFVTLLLPARGPTPT